MSKIVVTGPGKLEGDIRIHGAKNAVLPILAATVLNGDVNIIHDCPNLKDVVSSVEILKYLGCKVSREGNTLTVDSSSIVNCHVPEKLMREMRSSIIFLGAIAARCKEAIISSPGGCELGPRPIDIHIKALKELGMEISEAHGFITCKSERIHPTDIHLNFPSVGATENVMLAAAVAEGCTVITNAAKEPEIEDLQDFLNAMGARISGAGTTVVRIEGVKKLHGIQHTVIPDRIVAATYMFAAAMTGGELNIKNVATGHMRSVMSILKDCGANIYAGNDGVTVSAPRRILPVDIVHTMPHPGFPTDAQPALMSALCLAEGTSIIVENIFESRFRHAAELMRMGADITIDGRMAVVRGVKKLMGANVRAMDLRGGAALVIAGLAAEGETVVDDIFHIERGYNCFVEDLASIGANICKKD